MGYDPPSFIHWPLGSRVCFGPPLPPRDQDQYIDDRLRILWECTPAEYSSTSVARRPTPSAAVGKRAKYEVRVRLLDRSSTDANPDPIMLCVTAHDGLIFFGDYARLLALKGIDLPSCCLRVRVAPCNYVLADWFEPFYAGDMENLTFHATIVGVDYEDRDPLLVPCPFIQRKLQVVVYTYVAPKDSIATTVPLLQFDLHSLASVESILYLAGYESLEFTVVYRNSPTNRHSFKEVGREELVWIPTSMDTRAIVYYVLCPACVHRVGFKKSKGDLSRHFCQSR
ncbi:hypothetical protein BD626DRAFT_538521 [Schizophyllum amplum]|uniref:Uncharacterized protein n=1 Tax=Schizophyllum amplum TaxID=97359 RepID=A0A550C7L2_9AGAR|nr:hypothetical protein BD626DRAFT_538521 [Auriculariopsis ampla]